MMKCQGKRKKRKHEKEDFDEMILIFSKTKQKKRVETKGVLHYLQIELMMVNNSTIDETDRQVENSSKGENCSRAQQ